MLDVRLLPRSKSQPAYDQDALRELLEGAALRYQHAPELGNVELLACKAAGNLDPYAAHLDAHPEALDGLVRLLAWGEEAGETLALLCGCVRPSQCHRSVIAAAVGDRPEVDVQVAHLHPPLGLDRGPAPRILGLTLQQPWAWAICAAGKRIENRTWRPWCPPGTRLAIHAGKGWDGEGEVALLVSHRGKGVPTRKSAAQGIVAVARLAGVVERSGDPWFCGPYGWELDSLVVLPEPVPCKAARESATAERWPKAAVVAWWRDHPVRRGPKGETR